RLAERTQSLGGGHAHRAIAVLRQLQERRQGQITSLVRQRPQRGGGRGAHRRFVGRGQVGGDAGGALRLGVGEGAEARGGRGAHLAIGVPRCQPQVGRRSRGVLLRDRAQGGRG